MTDTPRTIGDYTFDPSNLLAFVLMIARQERVEIASASAADLRRAAGRLNAAIELARDEELKMETDRG